MSKQKGPVLIELRDEPVARPQSAPQPPELTDSHTVRALAVASRPPNALTRWFWRLLGAIAAFGLSIWAWNVATAALSANPVLGYAVTTLFAAFLFVAALIMLREMSAIGRLKRLDGLRSRAEEASADDDLPAARRVVAGLERLYAGMPHATWGLARLKERQADQLDVGSMLGLAEIELMTQLDNAARQEVEAAARRVATVTALVPLMMADVVVVLLTNLRMIRRIAEIYGGRSGVLGSWRITRNVLAHIVATGVVAIGDDMISSLAGGGLLSKVSRRFGEGVINGALTARVGVAAIEVCRPLPFAQLKRPQVRSLIARALTGLFGSAEKDA